MLRYNSLKPPWPRDLGASWQGWRCAWERRPLAGREVPVTAGVGRWTVPLEASARDERVNQVQANSIRGVPAWHHTDVPWQSPDCYRLESRFGGACSVR